MVRIETSLAVKYQSVLKLLAPIASQVEPTVTPASLSSDATTDSQSGKEKFSEEKEGKDGESIGKNTGYENIIQRNCEYLLYFHC